MREGIEGQSITTQHFKVKLNRGNAELLTKTSFHSSVNDSYQMDVNKDLLK